MGDSTLTSSCPPRAQLVRLLADALDPSEFTAVESHIEACGSCRDALEALGDDPLLEAWRACLGESGAAAPAPPPGQSVTADAGADAGAAEDDDGFTTDGPGARIGPYKLLGKIGEGGMGVVFLAEQEEPIRRKVALKIIRPGLDLDQTIARFEAERQALALMDHPQIARVLDAGTSESGRPYFVMDLVDGVPITEYCDANRLTPRERLELFIPVCRAIQHAHQKGIIHRDVKPSNILVTVCEGRAVPRVIDFGVAKAIGQRLTEKTMFTRYGAIVGTLEYMSPEQAEISAADIDTRSDIYSLGVVLYELLTGTTPLGRAVLREAAYSEVLRRIREDEPPRPSTRLADSKDALATISAERRTEPARLTRLVRGELDWIVMKALEKDRTRRYEAANDLARDIERYLAGEPVEAGPPSAVYRLRKLARKHRVALTTAAAFAALLVVASLVSTLLMFRARHAENGARTALAAETKANAEARELRVRAEIREQLAIDAVKRFRDAIHTNSELKNRPELEPLRKLLLKEPLAFFRQLRDQLQAEQDRHPDALVKLADACDDLAATMAEIGSVSDAIASYSESISLRDRLERDRPADLSLRKNRATSYNNVALLLHATGRTREAMDAHEKARAIREELARENPSASQYLSELATSHNNIGVILSDMGRNGEALSRYEQALKIRERLAREHPARTEFQDDLAASHHNIGLVLRHLGRSDRALEAYRKAIEIRDGLVRDHPTIAEFRGDRAATCNRMGDLHSASGHPAESMAAFRRAVQELERLTSENPSITRFQNELATSYLNIGVLLTRSGRSGDALKEYDRAIAIWRRLIRDNPNVTQFRHDLAAGLNDIGYEHNAAGRPSDALAAYRQALPILQGLADEVPGLIRFQSDLAACHDNMGIILSQTGPMDEAMAAYRSALGIRDRLAREDPTIPEFQSDLLGSHNNIGDLQNRIGQPARAMESYGKALDIVERLARGAPSNPDFASRRAVIQHNIAEIETGQGHWQQARERLDDAIVHQRAALTAMPGHPLYQLYLRAHLLMLAKVYQALNQPAEAVRAARECAVLARGIPTDLYNVSCALALSVPLTRDERAESLAAEAVQALETAIAAGWTDAVKTGRDPELAPLRDREDFRQRLDELFDRTFPADPFAH